MKNTLKFDGWDSKPSKKLLSAVLAILFLTATTTPLQGCSAATTVNEINTVLTEATNILTVADPTAPWAGQLKAAVAALKTAEAGWVGGGAVADVDAALNTIEAIVAVVPVTAAYAPLVDVLVAGVEAILAALPAPTAASVSLAKASNPHLGRVVIKHRLFHSRTKEFKDAWNAAVEKQGLKGALIQ
jgi:hypothetical protein